jgi:hypothetical protein
MDTAVANSSNASKPPPKMPLGERINIRMILVAVVVLVLIGYPVYQFVSASFNHGVEDRGDMKVVDLKALGNFPFDESNSTIKDVPPVYRDLDGKRVALDGFMYAGNSAGDTVDAFQFVYNITKCCFNGPPKVQERVFARSKDPVPYYGQMVRCVGTLHVGVKKNEAGQTSSVYELDVDKVEQL